MEPYDLAWAEDLLPPTDVDAWAALTASTHVPTLTGEGLHLRQGVPGVLPSQCHACCCSGLPDLRRPVRGQEGRRDGGHAADAGLPAQRVQPHRNRGRVYTPAPRSRTCWRSSSTPCPAGTGSSAGYRPSISDGFIDVPEGPGLGVELDEDEARRYLMPGETWFE